MKKVKLIEAVKKRFGLSEKEALAFIMSGKILSNEEVLTKGGFLVSPDIRLRIKNKKKYVSRGAYKLITALKRFDITVKGKICADFGSSTGGFTEVLLERGAEKVYAVDCGTNQLDYKLRVNPKVVSMENVKISALSPDSFFDKIDFAVMDISFTSALPAIKKIVLELDIKKIVALIKPQFEYERLIEALSLSADFNGVIGKDNDSERIISYVSEEIAMLDIEVYGIIPSEIKGMKGNQEYLFYMGV